MLYMNDIDASGSDSKLTMFVDDTTLKNAGKKLKFLETGAYQIGFELAGQY